MSDRSADARTRETDDGEPSRHWTGGDRAIGTGIAGFVVVNLLALLAFGDPSFPALVGVEAVAVGSLLAGDAVATGARGALPAGAGVLVALVAVRIALGPLGLATWVVAAGTLLVAGTLLYAGRRYDGFVAGGDPA